MAQESAKIAKMAKLEPRWSQHGSEMPKMRQHGLTLCLS